MNDHFRRTFLGCHFFASSSSLRQELNQTTDSSTFVTPFQESCKRKGERERERGEKGSISSTFYEQLLHSQILKAQKRQLSCQSFFALLGSTRIEAALGMLMK